MRSVGTGTPADDTDLDVLNACAGEDLDSLFFDLHHGFWCVSGPGVFSKGPPPVEVGGNSTTVMDGEPRTLDPNI